MKKSILFIVISALLIGKAIANENTYFSQFSFKKPCSEKKLFNINEKLLVKIRKDIESIVLEKAMDADKINSHINSYAENLNTSNADSILSTISVDIEKIVNLQNFVARYILKKLPLDNDFSYFFAQKNTEELIILSLPANVSTFCKTSQNAGCNSIKDKMKNSIDPDSLSFANNIDKNIYFNHTENQKLENEKMVCTADILVSKLIIKNLFSKLYMDSILKKN